MNNCLMNAQTISSGGSAYSLQEHLLDGMNVHSIEYEVTGSGTVTITAYTTTSGRNWIKDVIVAKGLVSTSGPEANGQGLVDVFLHPAEYVKFLVEAASADAIVTLYFNQK